MKHDEKMYAATVFNEVKNVAESEAKIKGYSNFFNDLFSDKFKSINIKPYKNIGSALLVDCIFSNLPEKYTSLLAYSYVDYFDFDGTDLYSLIFNQHDKNFGYNFGTQKTYSPIDDKYWYKVAYSEFLSFILDWDLELTIEYDETKGVQEVYYKYKGLNTWTYFTIDMKEMMQNDPKAFVNWMLLDPLESLVHNHLTQSFAIFKKE